jgi:O-antigen ligase
MRYLPALIKQTSYSDVRKFFLVSIIPILTLRFIAAYSLLPSFFDIGIYMLAAAFGMLVIFLGILKKEIVIHQKYHIWLILFLVAFIISCIANIKYGYFSNFKCLVWSCIIFFVAYSQSKFTSKHEKIKLLMVVQNILIVEWLVLSSFSILTFIFQLNCLVPLSDDKLQGTSYDVIRMGYVENRLFGVYLNPNTSSIIALLTIIFSVSALANPNLPHRLGKKIYILNIVLQYIFIVLTNSRGTELALLTAAFVCVFGVLYLKDKKFRNFIFSAAAAVMVCVILFFVIMATKMSLSYVPGFFNRLFIINPNLAVNKISVNRIDIENNGDISNLRFSIWKSALDIFKTTWLFGTSPKNIVTYAKNILPDTFIVSHNYVSVHNLFLGILVYTGILGTIFMGVFVIKAVFVIFRRYVAEKFSKEKLFNYFIVVTLLALFVTDLFEVKLLFTITLATDIFWMFLGYIMDEAESCSESKSL